MADPSDKDIPTWQRLGFPSEEDWLLSGIEVPAGHKPAKRIRKPNGHGPVLQLAPTGDDPWMKLLQKSMTGFKANDYNVSIAMTDCPQLAGAIRWDTRQLCYVQTAETPAGPAGNWNDSHTARLSIWLQSIGIPVTIRHVETALRGTITQRPIDPLGDYLTGLEWDGQERIGAWLATYCGADQSDANAIMGSKFLIGAIARALRPGCQMDYMLTLEGPQYAGKSSLVRILGGQWTSESLPDFHTKDAQIIAGSNWIIEVSELAAVQRSQLENVKAFITRRTDTFRPPYGRHQIAVPRWCCLIANYNPDGSGILQDVTGSRRFWVVAVKEIDLQALAKDRDQLWAEAVHCFQRGDAWWPTAEEIPHVAEQQHAREDSDGWQEPIRLWLATNPMLGDQPFTEIGHITTEQVSTKGLSIPIERFTRSTQIRIAKCLVKLGYIRDKAGPAMARFNCFRKPPAE